jgi:hypothetical protein
MDQSGKHSQRLKESGFPQTCPLKQETNMNVDLSANFVKRSGTFAVCDHSGLAEQDWSGCGDSSL